jgi:RHS repeat-associated protein
MKLSTPSNGRAWRPIALACAGAVLLPPGSIGFIERAAPKPPMSQAIARRGGPDVEAPWVQITPSGIVHSSAVNVLITYCDDSTLNANSRTITRDGAAWGLGYTTSTKKGCGAYATSSGSFTLGINASTTIAAAISDNRGNRGSASVTITYVPTYTVTVTADSAAVTRQSDASTSQTFTVRNSGSETASYTLTPTCSGGVSSCSAPGSVQVASGQSAPVTVSYHTAIGPATGAVSLQAVATQDNTATSTGSATVTVAALPANVMTNGTLPAWTGLERSQCVAIAIVRDVAAQCDAFRIVHPLPAVTTRAKTRVPTLVYLSDWVQGLGVSVNASIPTTIATIPDSVQFNVYRRNADSTRTLLQSRSYGWAVDGFGRAPERLSISGVTSLTGVLFYRLEVRFKSGAGTWQTNAQTDGEMLAANRAGNSFGAGWWLAGIEQLALNQAGSASRPDSVVAWIGGDGSMRKYVYRQTVSGQDVYTADYTPDRPDTLIKNPGAPSLPWTRHGGNNLRIVFDSYGRHSLTINRAGDTTRIAWKAGGAARLDTLVVPGGLRYVFQYDASDLLSTVVAPAASGSRQIQFARQFVNGTPTAGIRKITDPSQDSVTFEYPSWAPSTAIVARTDRRLVRTVLDWEPWGPGLTDAVTPDGNGNNVAHYFRNPANVGMAPTSKPISVDSLFLRYTNPRGYATSFWLNSLGAPTQIVNALGQTTSITYGDSRFPGLATQVVRPGGLTSQASYNARGLADSTKVLGPFGDSRNPTTRFTWDPVWNMVTGIHAPSGVIDSIAYDIVGNRLWQQDGRGSISRVNFGYDAQNRLISVQPPGNAADKLQRITYDPLLGNVSSITTPLGFVSHSYQDGIGRDTLNDTPIDTLQTLRTKVRTTYNVADEVDSTISIGPPVPYTLQSVGQAQWSSPVHAETLYVKHQYDAESNPTVVTSMPAPADTLGDLLMRDTYTYDNLGRRTSHAIAQGPWENTTYDLDGNVVTMARPSGTLTMSYDALDRLTMRVMPARRYGQQHCEGFAPGPQTGDSTGAGCFEVYPGWPNDSTGIGYLMMADTARFTYDANTGFMLTANNRYAQVHRSYYPNGAIWRDSLLILNGPTYTAGNGVVVGTSYTGASYGLTKQYTGDGKDSTVAIPGSGSVSYLYRSDNGALQSVTDPTGNWFRYTYDAASRVDSLLIGPVSGNRSIWETHVYDADGRQTRRIRTSASQPLFDESFWFDAQGRAVKVGRTTSAGGVPSDTSRFVYGGLGAVQARERIDQLSNWESEEYRVDALGNNLESRDGQSNNHGVHDPRYWTYTFHGELTARNTLQPQQATEVFAQGFDADGNVAQRFLVIKEQNAGGYDADDQVRNYYDAANRLRAVQHYNFPSTFVARGTFDEYEYDALGRRIVVVSHRKENIPACHPDVSICTVSICNTNSCYSSLTRYMWDGNATLAEDRQPYATSTAGPDDGYVTYVQGLELDRPLGVVDSRVSGNVRVPHPTWRGQYESSSTAGGAAADCSLTMSTCTLVGWNASASLYSRGAPSDVNTTYVYTWVGGLLMDQQDASGLLYRRNRYYDPMSGRFSQEDPIGLAGGLNTYGFAAGDPVSYSDPFGLCPANVQPGSREAILCAWIEAGLMAAGTDLGFILGGGGGLLAGPGAIVTSPAGAMLGAAGGGTLGLAAGKGITNWLFSKSESSSGNSSSSSIGDEISNGHAWDKHAGEFGELGIQNRSQFGKFIDRIVGNARGASVRNLQGGRTAFWDDETGTIVIRNPRDPDGGTAFRPTGGKDYFNNIR